MDVVLNSTGTLLRDMITENFVELCNAIECNDLFLSGLCVNGIITEGFKSEVKSLHENLEKTSKVMEFLQKSRTDADLPTFVDILKTSCNSKAVDLITGPITLTSSRTSYGYQGVVAGYIEREELQQQALEHLKSKPNRDTRITFPGIVFHGFGGNGKSQMARRLVQILTKELNNSENITNCISVWISADNEASVIEGFRNFANVTKEENVSGFYKEWKDRNLLLVFDDGDDFQMLKKFLPLDDTETNVRVIITAHSEWACGNPNVKNVPVSNFTVKEFRDFLAKAVNCTVSEEDAKQLAGHTGRIPAILSLVCKSFSHRLKFDSSYTIAKHFAKYGNKIFVFGEDGKLVPGLTESDYKKSAKIVVAQQLAFMENRDSDDDPELIRLAKFILNCMAYCDPVEISEQEFFMKHPEILRKASGDYSEIRQAIGVLKQFGWIEFVRFTYGTKLEVFSMHACYQIGLKSQLDEQTSESILHGMIEYLQVERVMYDWWEKYSHLAAFLSHVCTHANHNSLFIHCITTNHCLIGLAEKGLMDEFISLASVYQDQEELVDALLQGDIEEDLFPCSPMFYLLRKATNHDLVKYFILEIKAYYDHLEDSERKAWIRYQLLWATIGVIYSKEYETFTFILDSFNVNLNEGLGENRDTLLHRAVFSENAEFVQLLIEKGANIDAKNVRGETPLHMARNLEDQDTLIHGNVCSNMAKNVEIVRVLLNSGANISEKNDSGKTAFHLAVYWSDLEVVKLLIAKGADVNEKDVDGETPLHIVARKGELEIVRFLVENGANIYEEADSGKTALQVAINWSHLEVVKLLVEKGASVSGKDVDYKTPIHSIYVY